MQLKKRVLTFLANVCWQMLSEMGNKLRQALKCNTMFLLDWGKTTEGSQSTAVPIRHRPPSSTRQIWQFVKDLWSKQLANKQDCDRKCWINRFSCGLSTFKWYIIISYRQTHNRYMWLSFSFCHCTCVILTLFSFLKFFPSKIFSGDIWLIWHPWPRWCLTASLRRRRPNNPVASAVCKLISRGLCVTPEPGNDVMAGVRVC